MSTRLIDSVSAAVVAVAVWLSGRRRGLTARDLFRPRPFACGVAAAFTVEVAFARWPGRLGRLWRRPVVRVASPVALVAAVLAVRREDGWTHAVVLGGLTAYFGLLVAVLSGRVSDPETWFDDDLDESRSSDVAARPPQR